MVDNSKLHIPIKFVKKGWGYEKWIINKPLYCGKLLFFQAGKKCSWHYHVEKDEVFYLQSGKMIIRYSDTDDLSNAEELMLESGMNFYVYPGLRHQMEAVEDTELYEFSTQHFNSDSYRITKGD